jgi:hypothetical protein
MATKMQKTINKIQQKRKKYHKREIQGKRKKIFKK